MRHTHTIIVIVDILWDLRFFPEPFTIVRLFEGIMEVPLLALPRFSSDDPLRRQDLVRFFITHESSCRDQDSHKNQSYNDSCNHAKDLHGIFSTFH